MRSNGVELLSKPFYMEGVGGGAGPAWPGGISPMITSTKSTHESVPFKHSVARLYIARLC